MTTIEGIVVAGNRIGRKLGVPTANITLGEDAEVADGVYAAWVELEGVRYLAVANIGRKPTIGSEFQRGAEIHIIGFEGDLYGVHIAVTLGAKVRDERRFESLDALREQIQTDIEIVKNLEQ
jgi:riboflavin kinase/FMN adenylyltransferase